MKWLQLGNARNMLMTVNIKLSIIVIAEIIPSTDDTCLHQSISPQNGPSKVTNTETVRPQITNVNPLLQYYRLFQLLLQPYAEHEGIITKVYHRFNHRFRYTSIFYKQLLDVTPTERTVEDSKLLTLNDVAGS